MNKKIIIITTICCLIFAIIYIPIKRENNKMFIVTYLNSSTTENTLNESAFLDLTEDEINLLTKFIKYEVQSNDIEEKLGVGMVVLNRINNPNFPNTLKDVIYQPGYFSLPENDFNDIEIDNTDIQITTKILKMYNEKISLTDKDNNDLSQSLYWIDPTTLITEKLQELENQYTVLGKINNREFLK